MNLIFENVGRIERAGIPCLVQRAVVPADCKNFWIAWRHCQDKTLKDSLMLRKEAQGWVVHRTVPADPGLKLPPLPMPYVLKSTDRLLPYQGRSVAALARSLIDHGVAVDGSDTGLGKSYTALAVARETGLRPGVICRKAGIPGWLRACAYMGVEPLFVVNWEYAKTGKFPYVSRVHHSYEPRHLFSWRLPKNSLLIYDEVHMACNEGTINNDMWQAAKGLPSLALSATLADRPSRLATLFFLLGICNFDQYRKWLVRRGHFMNQHGELESLAAVQDMKVIHTMLYPRYGSRLSYQDPDVAAYFPGVVHQVELIGLDDSERALEAEAYGEMMAKIRQYREAGRSHADMLVAELRFRQAAELLKVPVLADLARNYANQGLSVCIFVNYRETLAALSKTLDTRSLIFGDQERYGVPRELVIKMFQENKTRIILCMIDAGGQSIDLHDIHGGHQRISLVCPCYNPISLKQVLGRTYRAGTKTTPVIKLVYAADTVEEKVARTVAAKLDNLDALNRGDLMEGDLFDILEHSAGASQH